MSNVLEKARKLLFRRSVGFAAILLVSLLTAAALLLPRFTSEPVPEITYSEFARELDGHRISRALVQDGGLILWQAEANGREAGLGDAAPPEEGSGAAGTLVAARGDELVVACGGGTTLRVLELQPEGKQRLKARDFVNGSRVKAGERLG